MTRQSPMTENVDDLGDDLELFELFAEIADDLDTGADDESGGLELFALFAEVCGQVFEVERMHHERVCGARALAAGRSVAEAFDWPRSHAAGLPS